MDPSKTQTQLPTSPSRHAPADQEQGRRSPPGSTWSWQGTTGHPAEPPWPEPGSRAGDDRGADRGGLSYGARGSALLLPTAPPRPVPSRRALAPRVVSSAQQASAPCAKTGRARPHPGQRPGHPAHLASPAGDPKLPWGPPDLLLEGIPVGCPQAPKSRETRQIQSGGWVPEGSGPFPCSKPLRLGGDTRRGQRRSGWDPTPGSPISPWHPELTGGTAAQALTTLSSCPLGAEAKPPQTPTLLGQPVSPGDT